MNASIFELQADFCKAIGNATRLQILYCLRKSQMSVNEVVRETGLNHSLISRHLGILRNAGAVKCHRHANEVLYELADESIGELCDIARKALSNQIQNKQVIS